MSLVDDIVPYDMKHNAEHEACDLLMVSVWCVSVSVKWFVHVVVVYISACGMNVYVHVSDVGLYISVSIGVKEGRGTFVCLFCECVLYIQCALIHLCPSISIHANSHNNTHAYLPTYRKWST